MPGAVTLTPIGVVRTPFATHEGMPIQTVAAQGVQGRIELEPGYEPGGDGDVVAIGGGPVN